MSADAEEPSCGLQHVEEAGELKHLVDQVASSAGAAAEAVFPRFALEDAVQPLTTLLRAAAADPAPADLQRVRSVSRLLWQLSVVRWGPTGTLLPCCPPLKQDRRNYLG